MFQNRTNCKQLFINKYSEIFVVFLCGRFLPIMSFCEVKNSSNDWNKSNFVIEKFIKV